MTQAPAPLAAPGTALTSFFNPSGNVQQVFYIATDQHVHQFYWTASAQWSPEDVTGDAGAPLAVPGSPLTGFFNPAGNYQQIFFNGTYQHVYSMFFSPSSARWFPQDLTAATNAPLAEPPYVTISGQVLTGSTPVSRVVITLIDNTPSTISAVQTSTTDVNGNYLFSVRIARNYKLTPSLPGYSFTPESAIFTKSLSESLSEKYSF